MKTHKFLRWERLCQLCESNKWTEELVETKLQNQAFAEKKMQEEASTSSRKSTDMIQKIDLQVAARKVTLEADLLVVIRMKMMMMQTLRTLGVR
mmetsp:Transcript_5197/g.7542  ORF Transcript_5197/g.7542 Transcript_5197/m.7542 type:complete len:94 (-) Transcript_5197:117-398(-)